MIYIIKHTIAVIIVLLFFSKSLAQSTPNTLPKRELRINVDAIMYQKLKVTSTNSSSLFNSRDIPSGILSVSNYFRIKHNFAIEPSIGFTVIPYNYSYNIELQPSHPLYKNRTELSHHSSEYPLPSSRVGISVSKEFDTRFGFMLFTGLGVNLNTYPTYTFRSRVSYSLGDSSFTFFNLELEDEGLQRAFWSNLSYSYKVGISKTNNKGNGYSVSLVFNLQPNSIGAGNYTFDQGSYKDSGTVEWKNSYYGFCFSKSFHQSKKNRQSANTR